MTNLDPAPPSPVKPVKTSWEDKVRAVNWNTLAGQARAFLPVICTLLVGWKMIPPDVANQIPDAVANGIVACGAISVVIAGIWSFFSNRPSAVAEQAASVPGTVVVVSTNAPSEMQKVANDPSHPGVVPAHAYIPDPPAGAG